MTEPRKIFGGLGNRMFQGAYLLAQQAKGEIPDIYLQDEKYFENVKEKVKATYGQGIIPSDYVSLHIRRGDYVNNPFYVDLTQTDYYAKAFVEMMENDTKFLVFCADRQEGSDDKVDIEWCKKYIELRAGIFYHRFKFFQGKDEIEDFNHMAGCKAHILANSSFSWWAAYVGGGKTVAPREWFTDKVERVRLLDEWIKI